MADNNNNDKRGLASADKETRERVAREGGKASHGGRDNEKNNGNERNRNEDDNNM